ncbi:sensor histidine kinase [Hyphomonas sp.]|uniref:sensor histidine kinase n=1 Tax=Hyphomonas sp. TaxID=87 RepID=UPI00391E020D
MLRQPVDFVLPDWFAGENAEPMLDALLQNSGDCIKLVDPDGRLVFVNQNGVQLLGLSESSEIVGKLWWDLWPAEARDAVRQAVAQAVSGETAQFRGICKTARGVSKWWDVRVIPVVSSLGGGQVLLVISRDVTEANASRTMYETIALEMRHRLKNAFAVSSAIAKISARQRPEYQPFAEELVSRFSSLAIAQGKLVEEASTFPLRDFLADLVNAAGAGEENIDVTGLVNCDVDEMQMRVIAVVIGELTTNSLKYGALRNGKAVRCSGAIEDGRLRLAWFEPLDGELPDEEASASSTGAGLKVIERIVASAGGEVERSLTADELNVSFSLYYSETSSSEG